MEMINFIEITSKAETYFEKEYSTEQRNIMYEEVKKMSAEKYQKVISSCIRNCKFLPKLSDIFKAANEIYCGNYQPKREYVACEICKGKGFVRYTKILKENGYEYDYACRCICKNADYYNKNIPTFEDLGIQPGDKLVMNFE